MTAQRFHGLDGLRGFAAFAVFITHSAPQSDPRLLLQPLVWLANIGWAGVDLFFVLSGFLITGILLDQKGKSRYFFTFYWHRALRIFPLYLLLLCITTVVGVFYGWPAWLLYVDGPMWPYWTFVSNVGPFVGVSMAAVSYLLPCWSLAIEEQFYVVWSAIVRIVGIDWLAWIAALALCASISLRYILFDKYGPSATFYFTATHLDALCCGIILRVAYTRLPQTFIANFARSWWLLALICGAVLAVDYYRYPGVPVSYRPMMMHVGLTVISVFCAALVAHGIAINGWVRLVFNSSVLTRLGLYSYFIYLYQNIINDVILRLWPSIMYDLGVIGRLAFVFGCILILAHFSNLAIEGPARRLRHSWGSRKSVSSSIEAAATAGIPMATDGMR